MAGLDGDIMGVAVAAAVKTASAAIDPTGAVSDAQLQTIWKAACTAIVAHIKANGLVTTPGTTYVSGSPGSPVGGTGIGTIT